MKSYLMMLYVTFEQESALKKFFHVQGWSFCKPDLSVTTDKLGPTIYRTSVKEQPELLKPLYKEKRTLKPGNIQESPPAKLLKTAEGSSSTQNKQSEIKETCSAEESGAEEQLPVTFANATNSYKPIKTQSSTSIVLPDGNEVTVKMEADESDGNGADDTLGNSDNNEDDDTDVDYSFEGLEEGELRLKTEDVSDAEGDQIGDNSTLDNSAEDQSQEKAQTSGKQKPDGAKGKRLLSIMEVSFTESSSIYEETKIPVNLSVQEEKTMSGQVQSQETSDADNTYLVPVVQKSVFQCNQCPYRTARKPNFYRHRKAVHQNRRFACDTCGKQYREKYDLKEHVQAVHRNITFLCEVCSKSFTNRKMLNLHKKHIHNKDYAFKCGYCQKEMETSNQYHGHINMHLGSKPYTCTSCSKSFSYKSSLQRHIVTCTGDAERYRCTVCNKVLSSSNTLNDHMRGKHGPKDKICRCGKSFAWRTSLKRHQKTCRIMS